MKRRHSRAWGFLGVSCLLVAACAGRSLEGDESGQGARASTGGRGAGAGATGGIASGASGGVAGTGGYTSCFEAGALVATPRGSVAIESLAVGDEVLAFDERTGTVAPRRILRTFVHETTRTGTLELRDGRTLRVTPEHPVFVARTQRFERADAIRPDDALVTLPVSLGGSALVAAPSALPPSVLAPSAGYALRELDTPVTVYNLSVEDFETYFVEGVLVHNKTGGTSYAGAYSGGKGGSAGTSGESGSGGNCEPEQVEGSVAESCEIIETCLDQLAPVDDFVRTNRLVSVPVGAGGGGNGEASQGGDDGGGAAGERGTDAWGFEGAMMKLCQPDASYPIDDSYYLAYDAYQPAAGTPTHSLMTSFGICEGVVIGEVVMTDFSVPEAGSWTTQCVRLTGDEIHAEFHLGASNGARLANPRFVVGCECPRELKRYTTCGYDPGGHGGGSACEVIP